MYYLYIVAGIALIISLAINRQKTRQALYISGKRLLKILPALLLMLILTSVVLYLVSDQAISQFLGNENKLLAVIYAALFGSITIMPGFIAFPLSGLLLKKGVLYMVLSAFTTTLMMVGVLTYPIEKEYFGLKVTIIRNAISLVIALAVAVMTGIFFAEIF